MGAFDKFASLFSFKYIALAMLVLQNTFLIIFMSMSRTTTDGAPKLYATSTAVVTMEVVKLVSCICVVYYESVMQCLTPSDTPVTVNKGIENKSIGSLIATVFPESVSVFLQTMDNELLKKPQECVKCSVPSFLYTIQNNLLYYALSHLDAATFQVGYQTKIITTAIFSYFMLNKRLSKEQWGSLVLLTVGVSMAQISSQNSGLNAHSNTSMGFIAVFAAAITSGFSGVYFEHILKTSSSSIWIRNIQMSVFSIIIALVTVYLQEADYKSVVENGFFYGYTNIVWSVILLQAVGGLVVAVVVKYADNILKGFAASFSIITSCILSYFLVNFQPSMLFVVGAILVNAAMYVYGKYPYISPPELNGAQGHSDTKSKNSSSSSDTMRSRVHSGNPSALSYLTQTKQLTPLVTLFAKDAEDCV